MQCKHDFKPGICLTPILGRSDGKPTQRGDTISPVDSEIQTCDKCEKCGESRVKEQKVR